MLLVPITILVTGLTIAYLIRRIEPTFFQKFRLQDVICVTALAWALLLLGGFFFGQVFGSHFDLVWDSSRLAPLFGLAEGYELYYGPQSGPAQSTLYGPVAWLIYFVTLMADTPTQAVLLGYATNVAIMLVPLVYILSKESDALSANRANFVLIGLCLFLVLALSSRASQYMTFRINADAPALALALSASAFIYGRQQVSDRKLALSALFAVLAIWSKQVEVAILPGIAIYLLFSSGLNLAIKYTANVFVVGLMVSLLFVGSFGWDETIFNIITNPSSHPWRDSIGFYSFFAKGVWGYWIIALLSCVYVFYGHDRRRRSIKEALTESPQTLFLLLALCMIPMSVIGRLKVGGGVNAFHYLHYLNVFSAITLAKFAVDQVIVQKSKWLNYAAQTVVFAVLVYATSYGGMRNIKSWAKWDQIYDNPLEFVFLYSKNSSGQAHFPWHVLPVLMAEGKLFNSAAGVIERDLADYRMSKELYLMHVPSDPKYIVFPYEVKNGSIYRQSLKNMAYWDKSYEETSLDFGLGRDWFLIYQRN